jgi:hypothetical protein
MKQARGAGKVPDSDSLTPPGNGATPRKPYVPPALLEYGTIAKLTQGSKTRSNDGKNTRKLKACL